jgi:hypothetical protein
MDMNNYIWIVCEQDVNKIPHNIVASLMAKIMYYVGDANKSG